MSVSLMIGKQSEMGDSLFSREKIFAANMDNVPDMLDYIHGFLKDFTPEIVFETTLACEEILVNIVSYAYPDGGGQLAIAWKEDSEQHKFWLRFEDSGIPFNPLLIKKPDLSAPIGEKGIGGLGILIVRALTDHIQYAYVDGKNSLIITKEY